MVGPVAGKLKVSLKSVSPDKVWSQFDAKEIEGTGRFLISRENHTVSLDFKSKTLFDSACRFTLELTRENLSSRGFAIIEAAREIV